MNDASALKTKRANRIGQRDHMICPGGVLSCDEQAKATLHVLYIDEVFDNAMVSFENNPGYHTW